MPSCGSKRPGNRNSRMTTWWSSRHAHAAKDSSPGDGLNGIGRCACLSATPRTGLPGLEQRRHQPRWAELVNTLIGATPEHAGAGLNARFGSGWLMLVNCPQARVSGFVHG